MNPESAQELSLAPNQRARSENAQNKFSLGKRAIIITIIVISFLIAILTTYLLTKKSAQQKSGEIPPSLSGFPVYPEAKIIASVNAQGQDEVEWEVNKED